jgi:hypothetical protein
LPERLHHPEQGRVVDGEAQRDLQQPLLVPAPRCPPTYGAVFGVSKFGLARFGEANLIEAIRSPGGGHTEDSLIAHTARYEAAILVTGDRRLTSFARREAIEVWSIALCQLRAVARLNGV